MAVISKVHCAGLSDTGRARKQNEDRIHLDPERGIFIVADGLGGHAAGERAAQTAVDMISQRLRHQTGSTEERIREAIAVANNEINTLARQNPEWKGMASVVTLAVIEDDHVTAGHVGDSRMYLIQPGAIRKVTRDHSPVGELEDAGQLSEAAAMAHPRRNEVFRDLGSEPHGPHDEDYIDIVRFTMSPDSALLICSDGLSDQVPAAEIQRIVESNARRPNAAVRELVNTANAAGGKDNVSVVLVVGPAFGPRPEPAAVASKRRGISPAVPFLLGFLLALVLLAATRPYLMEKNGSYAVGFGTVPQHGTLRVGPGGATTIAEALAQAASGDTIYVAPGTYRENIELKSGVVLLSEQRRAAIIETSEIGVSAASVTGARLSGFRIAGNGRIGIRIIDSDIQASDMEVSGMSEAGIEIGGDSTALISGSAIHGNPGTGILIHGGARPVIANNWIRFNGTALGEGRPGIHIVGSSAPSLQGNIIEENAVEEIWASPLFNTGTLFSENIIAPGVRDRARQIKVVTR
jgi:PPM family protein phosphatase